MFLSKLFKRKTEAEKLSDKYDLLMKEAYKLSKINRTESDKKYLEADKVLSELNQVVEEHLNKKDS